MSEDKHMQEGKIDYVFQATLMFWSAKVQLEKKFALNI